MNSDDTELTQTQKVAALLCAMTDEKDAKCGFIRLGQVSEKGKEIGDWIVFCQRIDLPHEWQIVPVNPTDMMKCAPIYDQLNRQENIGSCDGFLDDFSAERVYAAMLAVAPEPLDEE